MFSKKKYSKEKLTDLIRHSIASVAEVDDSVVEDDMHLIDDLGFDSMTFLAALTLVEEKTGIKVDEGDFKLLYCVSEWVNYFDKHLNG